MATNNLTMTRTWQLVHLAVVDNTNVILTPDGRSVEWAVDASTPSETLLGHNLSEVLDQSRDTYRDRGFLLSNGEGLYLRGPNRLNVAMTVST